MANDSPSVFSFPEGIKDQTAPGFTGSVFINNNSYSGCDIKVLVHIYDDGKISKGQKQLLESQLDEALKSLQQAQRDASDLITDIPNYKQGTDVLARKTRLYNQSRSRISILAEIVQSLQDRLVLVAKDPPKSSTKVLAECQTLSLSTFRDKQAVRACGSVYPKGFCLPETARILTKHKGYISIKNIELGDLVHSSPGQYNKVLGVYKQEPKECYRIKLSDGYELEGSFDHPVMTQRGWVNFESLKTDDCVAVCNISPIDTKELDIPDWIIKMSAYLIGDAAIRTYEKSNGSIEHRISLSIANSQFDSIGKEVSEILQNAEIEYKDYPTVTGGSIQRRISVCKKGKAKTDWHKREYNQLHNFLLESGLYGSLAHTKFIPSKFITSFSKRQTALFLNRLFSTDGGYSVSGNEKYIEVCYSSVSEQLIDEVRILLNQLGINCCKYKESKIGKIGGRPEIISRFDCYRLVISESASLSKFIEIVGIYSKQEKVQTLVSKLRHRIRDHVLDIPMKEFRDKVTTILKTRKTKDITIQIKKFCAEYNLYNSNLRLTPRRALMVADVLKDQELSMLIDNKVNDLILHLGEKELFSYKEIRNIENIGVKEVWDLTIEGQESFIANHIYVHNTRGPREIAGSLIFTVFNQHVFYELLEAHVSDFDGVTYTSAVMDQLPPLDIVISFANEYGHLSRMEIYGVEFVSDGMTMSIEDILTENVCNYVARDYNPMRAVATREIDKVSQQLQASMAMKASDLLLEEDYKIYKDASNPWEKFNNRRNPFI